MKCPICGYYGTKVVGACRSINDREANKYRRYRKCIQCGAHFRTVEKYAKDYTAPKAYIKKYGN